MKIKRFFAPDMRQAMRQVRQEVGPDAVILSNKRVAGGIEIMVAIDYEPPASQAAPATKSSPSAAPQSERRTPDAYTDPRLRIDDAAEAPTDVYSSASIRAGKSPSPLAKRFQQERQGQQGRIHAPGEPMRSERGLDTESIATLLARLEQERQSRRQTEPRSHSTAMQEPAASPAQPEPAPTYHSQTGVAREEPSSTIAAMKSEIEQLRGLLERQLHRPKPSGQDPHKNVQIQLQTRLHKLGLAVPLSRKLSQLAEGEADVRQAWKHTLAKLAEQVLTYPDDLAERGGMLALIGPTGSGKTTTIGKLATRYVLQHGSAGLALVTTDCYRIAAHEQLRVFGHILDVPVRVVDERHSLNEVLHSLRDKTLVLIDTAGMSAQDVHRDKQLRQLNQVSLKMRKLLVLPCTSQLQVLRAAYQSYRPLGVDGGVLTKADEALNLGEALSVVIEQGLRIAYITDGQRVPDDLALAKSASLVSRALHIVDQATESVSISQHFAQSLGRAG